MTRPAASPCCTHAITLRRFPELTIAILLGLGVTHEMSAGTRIKIDSTSPVSVLDHSEIELQGTTSIEELISALPQGAPPHTSNFIIRRGSTGTILGTARGVEPNTFLQPAGVAGGLLAQRTLDTNRVVVGVFGVGPNDSIVSFNTAGVQHFVQPRPQPEGGFYFFSAGAFFNEFTVFNPDGTPARSRHYVANEFSSPPGGPGDFLFSDLDPFADGSFLHFRSEGTFNQGANTYSTFNYAFKENTDHSIDFATRIDFPYAHNTACPTADGSMFLMSNTHTGIVPATAFCQLDANGDIVRAYQADNLHIADFIALPDNNTLIVGAAFDPAAGSAPTDQDTSAFLALLPATGAPMEFRTLLPGGGVQYMAFADDTQIVLCSLVRPESAGGAETPPGTGYIGVVDFGLQSMTLRQSYREIDSIAVRADLESAGVIGMFGFKSENSYEVFPTDATLVPTSGCDFLIPTTETWTAAPSPFTATTIPQVPINISVFDNGPNLNIMTDSLPLETFAVAEEPICAEGGGFPATLDVDSTAVDVFGGTLSIGVKTFGSWQSQINVPWGEIVNPAGGMGNGDGLIDVHFDANPTDQPRTAMVDVNGTMLNFTQAGLTMPVEVRLVGTTEVPFSGGQGLINIVSRDPVNALSSSFIQLTPQIEPSPASGVNELSLPPSWSDGDSLSIPAGLSTIEWSVNNSAPVASRSGQIWIVDASGNTIYTLTINQEGAGGVAPVNMSARTTIGSGDNILIPGFAVGGAGTTRLLLRGVGPTLGDLGVAGTLDDPQILLFSGSTQIAQNDSWQDDKSNLEQLFAELGAFDLTSELDSALTYDLNPGAYTIQMKGSTGGTGVGLMELYVLDPAANSGLVNLSARAEVGTGDRVMIPGFVISGDQAVQVLVRGIGPKLAEFGVTGVLDDPVIEVRDAGNNLIDTNDDWGTNADLTALTDAFTTSGAFELTTGSKDAAILLTLNPGVYTAVIRGKESAIGVALLEVYFLRNL